MTRFLSSVSLTALLVGCGPSLTQVVRTTQAFSVQQRCSQGPFELHVPAFGSKWGEDITVEARGNPVSGRATIFDGRSTIDSTFENSSTDASACMLSDADRGAVASGMATGATSPSTSATTTTSTSTSSDGMAATVALLEAGIPNTWLYRTEVARYHNEVNDWTQAKSILERGHDVKVVFWSEHPLDLRNTVFVLTHSEMIAPGKDDKKWQAHLDDVKSEAQAEATKQEAEAAVKVHEEARCRAIQGADKKCHDAGFKTAPELAAYTEFQGKCRSLAKSNATDRACRDDGWRNDDELVHPASPAVSTMTATSAQAHDAFGPPPAPQAEAQLPKPSTNAEWVPGSWQWNGFDWVWLSGGWRVPEQDRAQRLTATAPSAPPPLRVEARSPQPIASAVWADGYWHYANGQWVWVGGRWVVPPRIGATWRPSVWLPDGAHLRLDPGGWR